MPWRLGALVRTSTKDRTYPPSGYVKPLDLLTTRLLHWAVTGLTSARDRVRRRKGADCKDTSLSQYVS